MNMGGVRRSLAAVVAVVLAAPSLLTVCLGGTDPAPAARVASAPGSAPPSPGAPVTEAGGTGPSTITLTPANGKKDVPVSAEIGVKVTGGSVATVTVKDAKGGAVAGKLRDDGSSWVPSKPLQNKRRYAATVTASDGTSAATSFTTMAKPSRETGTGLYLFDDHTYGVAMPVVVEFVPGIKQANRAAVQKRLFVQTDPPQPGTWSWVSSGTQAYYRAPQYWRPGTKLTVRIAV
ncbi:MAG: hypothetical protein QOE51_4559, partial [Actinoplanes sp.]|nr:hypothetical protein [Actinoplanes sp.]